jgi:hypothetical protein
MLAILISCVVLYFIWMVETRLNKLVKTRSEQLEVLQEIRSAIVSLHVDSVTPMVTSVEDILAAVKDIQTEVVR